MHKTYVFIPVKVCEILILITSFYLNDVKMYFDCTDFGDQYLKVELWLNLNFGSKSMRPSENFLKCS